MFLVIVVTDRHTDTPTHKPTPVKTYSLAFAGIKILKAVWQFQNHRNATHRAAGWWPLLHNQWRCAPSFSIKTRCRPNRT